jgi:leucyl aminopeptidase
MLATLEFPAKTSAKTRRAKPVRASHRLCVLALGDAAAAGAKATETIAGDDGELLTRVLRRRRKTVADLATTPVSATTDDGALVAWIAWDARQARFDRFTALRKAVAVLLADGAERLSVGLAPDLTEAAANEVLYVCWVNGVTLPSAKAEAERRPLARIDWQGAVPDHAAVRAIAEGNVLARRLTAMAPNVLTPQALRREAAAVARRNRFGYAEHGLKALDKLGCGAFLSVAQGSADDEAAIVRLSWAPRGARGRIALVGKGICFDTGGYNLKPARAMTGMHEDMGGAAVVLGLMQAVRRLELPLAIDGWLAVSRNRIAPGASVPGDVVRACNGKTIEVVHTDAEGRMVLADTLALAVRDKPDLVLDFATLTGSMVVALGCRMSGVLSPDAQWAARAADAGARAGERLVPFPVPEDYAGDLESKVADIRQCTLDGEADHILAASFLQNFVGKRPWLHVDMSAVRCKGGLGAVDSELTGFGVALGVELLRDLAGTL